ncbi:hypothetical protein AJ80_01773 [Polytolypa hystricis UAMH7299]|uniref:Uncharacterized protein n=1 Tax=Polytolypa hystricis (strain UAMH7299) TaxID=1447883 RepID=A0A2B7YZ86_POLH7|nr:hypothetical protein AJ80_01773 [Polytolypa hystricis UAMH7299]
MLIENDDDDDDDDDDGAGAATPFEMGSFVRDALTLLSESNGGPSQGSHQTSTRPEKKHSTIGDGEEKRPDVKGRDTKDQEPYRARRALVPTAISRSRHFPDFTDLLVEKKGMRFSRRSVNSIEDE